MEGAVRPRDHRRTLDLFPGLTEGDDTGVELLACGRHEVEKSSDERGDDDDRQDDAGGMVHGGMNPRGRAGKTAGRAVDRTPLVNRIVSDR
jgi:hypothetical protein